MSDFAKDRLRERYDPFKLMMVIAGRGQEGARMFREEARAWLASDEGGGLEVGKEQLSKILHQIVGDYCKKNGIEKDSTYGFVWPMENMLRNDPVDDAPETAEDAIMRIEAELDTLRKFIEKDADAAKRLAAIRPLLGKEIEA